MQTFHWRDSGGHLWNLPCNELCHNREDFARAVRIDNRPKVLCAPLTVLGVQVAERAAIAAASGRSVVVFFHAAADSRGAARANSIFGASEMRGHSPVAAVIDALGQVRCHRPRPPRCPAKASRLCLRAQSRLEASVAFYEVGESRVRDLCKPYARLPRCPSHLQCD
jgi:hypothetical protein